MDKQKQISFTIITLVVGFMIAIQFQTIQEPTVRDTRDTWELREAIMNEKELQSNLIKEIRANEEKMSKYETKRSQSKEAALRETLEELKREVGLTDVTGPGIELTISPIYEEIKLGSSTVSISPELLKRLINDLNMYNALHISIDGQRLINTTVIRDINGETKIDGHPLTRLPIVIKIVVADEQKANKIYNQMQVARSIEDFFIDNLQVTISKPKSNILIPAYDNSIRIKDIEAVK